MKIPDGAKLPRVVIYSLLIGLTLLSVATGVGLVRADRLPRLVRGVGSSADTSVVAIASGGGAKNQAKAVNHCPDGRLRVRTNVDFARIKGDKVTPENSAEAESSGQNCHTYALAVQVAVYERGASQVSPVNVAAAVNVKCTGCVTVARAIQYVIPVDDVQAVPKDVDALFKELDKEAHDIAKSADNIIEAHTRLNGVVGRYRELAQYVKDVTDETKKDTGAAQGTPTAGTPGGAGMQPTGTPVAAPTQPTTAPATATTQPTSAPATATTQATAQPTVAATTTP